MWKHPSLLILALGFCGCSSAPQPPAATAPAVQPISVEISVSTVSREAAGLFDEAMVLEDAGDTTSVSKLRAALELDPSFALAHAALIGAGSAEEDAQHIASARRSLQALPKLERLWVEVKIASETETPMALAALEAEHASDWRIQREIALQALFTTLDKRLARAAFERVIALRPESVGALDKLAYLYSDDAVWPKALALAERQVSLTPTRTAAIETLAEVQLMAGKLDASEASFKRALELDKTSGSAHEGLASVAFSRDQWALGIETLNRAIADIHDPTRQGELRLVLIWALVAESRVDEARKLYEQSLAADDEATALKLDFLDLQIAVELGQWGEAEQLAAALAEKAGAAAPRLSLRLLGLRPVIAARLGKLSESQAAIDRLAESLQGKPAYLRKELSVARGELALAQGHSDEALAAFSDKRVLNHCSLEDPGRTLGRPGFEHYALGAQLWAAETQLRAGRVEDANARLTALAQLQRRGIGAQAVLRRARMLLSHEPRR